MEDLSAEIKKLQEKLYILLKQHNQLEKENQHLKDGVEKLKDQLLQKEEFINNSQQKSLAEHITILNSTEEKKDLEQKIDFYLKDIEKCLSLLNA